MGGHTIPRSASGAIQRRVEKLLMKPRDAFDTLLEILLLALAVGFFGSALYILAAWLS